MIENLKQYELAWSEFIEWCEANSFWLAPSLEESRRDLCKDDLRHLLADLQQFLDEKGIYCDAFCVTRPVGGFNSTVFTNGDRHVGRICCNKCTNPPRSLNRRSYKRNGDIKR